MKAASGGSVAAGCLLSAAVRGRAACQISLCFLCAYVQMQPAMQMRRMHTQVNNQAAAGMQRSSLLHVKTRMQVQNIAFIQLLLFVYLWLLCLHYPGDFSAPWKYLSDYI